MPTDRVLIEIVTAANMAGITEAKAGLFGLNNATLGLGAALGILGIAGKDAMAIAESTAKANNNLAQAVAENNAQVGKASAVTVDVTKQTIAHDAAVRRLAEVQAGMPTKHRATTLELMHLQDAQKKVADTSKALADALAAGKIGSDEITISLSKEQAQINTFIQTNRDYISNQSDVVNSYAGLVRSGLSQIETQRVMNDALDLAALKGISLTDAVTALRNAEFGRMRGLIDLGITTTKYTDAQGNLVNASKDVGAAMAEVDAKVKGGRDTLTDLEKTSNRLKNDWQDLANVLGPPMLDIFDKLIAKVDSLYQALQGAGQSTPSPILQNVLVGWGQQLEDWLMEQSGDEAWNKKHFPTEYARLHPTSTMPYGGKYTAGSIPPPGVNQASASDNAFWLNQQLAGSGITGYGANRPTTGTQLTPDGVQTVAALKQTELQLKTMDRNLEKIQVALGQPRTVVYSTVNSYNQTDAQLSAMIARNLRKIGVT